MNKIKYEQIIKLYSDEFLEMLNMWFSLHTLDIVCPFKHYILEKTENVSNFYKTNVNCNNCAKIFQYENIRIKFLKLNKFKNQKVLPSGPCPCQKISLPYVMNRLIKIGYKLNEDDEWILIKSTT